MRKSSIEADTAVPQFGTIETWCRISGQGRTKAYEALAAGQLRGVKNGRRLLIDIQAGLAWLRTLPPATYGSDKRAA